ncbi:MAG: S8 family serine peptidase, partial [Bdellovibrionales bacterium]|nr:S8 family serine peptidase [Bdellovibrionales bacterium]
NGFPDDVHGFDFVDEFNADCAPNEDCEGFDGDPTGTHPHGTQVAGIAAAATNNANGIAGIALNSKIMMVRAGFKKRNGEVLLPLSSVLNAMMYAALNGADVINLSLGGGTREDYQDVLAFTQNLGITVVAAAGNSAESDLPYPAKDPRVIAVGAIDGSDDLASFSNFGTDVDILAPGVSMLSTSVGGGYESVSGTSYSAPLVAGAAAMALSIDGLHTPDALRSMLVSSARQLPDLEDLFEKPIGVLNLDGFMEIAGASGLNHPPAWNSNGQYEFEVFEEDRLFFQFNASDPDDDDLTYSVENLPEGAEFSGENQSFTWVPSASTVNPPEREKDFIVQLIVSDGAIEVKQAVRIKVKDLQRAPVLDFIGNKRTYVGSLLEFTVTASDPNDDELNFSASGLPSGAAFDVDTQEFSWTPVEEDIGEHQVTFKVSDGVFSDEETITIEVRPANRPPEFDDIVNKDACVGVELVFSVHAEDPNGDTVTYSVNPQPGDSTFDSATGEFKWTPKLEDIGDHLLFYTASDGELEDSAFNLIKVTDCDARPFDLVNPGNRTVDEGETVSFRLEVTGAIEGTSISYTAINLPEGATLVG